MCSPEHGTFPTANLHDPDPALDLDYITHRPEADRPRAHRRQRIRRLSGALILSRPERRRTVDATAVVTGIGITSPNGLGTEQAWKATLEGRSGLSTITRFDASKYPSTVGGEISDYIAEDHIPSRLMPQTDHQTRLAMTAAQWALEDARLSPGQEDEFEIGVVTAASGGAVAFGQRELQNLWAKGKEHVSAYQSFAWFYAVNNGQISIRHGLRGPGGVLVTEQAGGIDASVRHGGLSAMRAISPEEWMGHCAGMGPLHE